jgi:type IV pilus assembly protein PilY1
MNLMIHKLTRQFGFFGKTCMVALVLVLTSIFAHIAHAQIPAVPPNIKTESGKPMVMLNMSRDHQLFYRAYNEYTDINLDGIPDTTYNHSIDYYGYFDSFKCYNYSGTASKFTPASISTNKYCSGQWSGNFLNWATMTRVDVVRKVLYGGYRSTDTGSSTVLERSYLPTDSHSFAKYYNGADLIQLTPFTAAQLAQKNVAMKGLGAWWENANAAGNSLQPMTGITICNTTMGSNTSAGGNDGLGNGATGVNRYSQTNTNPPVMRVAFGDFSLWNANERWQCYWEEEISTTNGNNPALTGLAASPRNPQFFSYWMNTLDNAGNVTWNNYPSVAMTTGGAGPDFAVRIDACVTGLFGKERCSPYPDGNSKPIGLLQEFGEANAAEFALITGSYAKNISGGVLRKNMESFRPEVNRTTNGTFTGVDGIVKTLDKIRIYGYDYQDGTYGNDLDNSGNWCSYQLTGLVDNQCSSWGNPLGEMFLESLRYLGGKANPTPAFAYTSAGSKDAAIGLGQVTWVDPFTRGSSAARAAVEAEFGAAQCRAINVLNFNASVISYDKDGAGGFSDLTSTPLSSLLDAIGLGEGINGTSRLVGGNGSNNNRVCDGKTLNSLADAEGLCPDAPAYKGSYNLAGLAYWAHTNRIRTDIATTDPKAFKVDSYSVALSPGSPRIVVPSLSNATNKVIIQPAYRLDLGGTNVGGGTLVDFRIVAQTPSYGKYLIVWEDSEQGGDYDQDVSGILEYFVVGDQLRVRTSVFAAATANPQGFGYVISGTQGKDGVHYHSGILNFSYTDSTNITVTSTNPARLNTSGGCVDCQVNDPATTALYTIVGGNTQALQDPLYYAAKWGGFTRVGTSANETPTSVASWDNKKQDGSIGSDGVPDNYFVVYRPDLLEQALRRVFTDILSASNTAPSVSSSELNVGSFKVEAKFDPKDYSGKLVSYIVNADGSFATTPNFSGDSKLTLLTPALRQIITNVGGTGVPFTYAAITAATPGGLTYGNQISPNATTATAIIEFMRGDRSNEGLSGLRFRKRNDASIMGAVINSTPWVQRPPAANYTGTATFAGFSAFANAQKNREKVIWVGANDGMLHGFKADNLDPVISYVPGLLSDRLKNTADADVAGQGAYADGAAFTADVSVSGTNWKTYLFSSLGRSKPGIFALDVTTVGGLNQTAASSVFKWQFSASDDADLGHVIAQPTISRATGQVTNVAKFRNGKFGLMFGNGVQSSSGKAALYILFVQGPSGAGNTWVRNTDYVKLEVPGNITGNGLNQIFWNSKNNDNVVDEVYAGDLKGNLWKFNVGSTTVANWEVAYGKPLYTAKDSAGNPLPITSAPITAAHPKGGRVVMFGTGQSIFSGDYPKLSTTQRVFGVWDKTEYAATPANIPVGVTQFYSRTLVVTPQNTLAPATTQTAMNWNTYKGYYMDIPYAGGAVLTNPVYNPDGTLDVFMNITFSASNNLTCGDPSSTNILILEPISGVFQDSITLPGQNPYALPSAIDGPSDTCVGPGCKKCVGLNCKPPPCTDPKNCPCLDGVKIFTSEGEQCKPSIDSIGRIQLREIPGIFTGPRN